jgi:hypothetical protein
MNVIRLEAAGAHATLDPPIFRFNPPYRYT